LRASKSRGAAATDARSCAVNHAMPRSCNELKMHATADCTIITHTTHQTHAINDVECVEKPREPCHAAHEHAPTAQPPTTQSRQSCASYELNNGEPTRHNEYSMSFGMLRTHERTKGVAKRTQHWSLDATRSNRHLGNLDEAARMASGSHATHHIQERCK
jgi:hypothetical protein